MTQATEPSNAPARKQYHIGIVYWSDNDYTSRGFCRVLEHLGYRATGFMYNAAMPEGLDIVTAGGPLGSLVPVARQILALPHQERPVFWLRMSEQFPSPRIPEWIRYTVGVLRTQGEKLAYRRPDAGIWKPAPWLKWLTRGGYRYRYYGDLFWLKRAGILNLLTTPSKWWAEFLRTRGFDPLVMPLSRWPEEWDNLELERDIPVLWLGKVGSSRRGNLLNKIRAELSAHGVEMLVIDGIENPYVFGKERAYLLSRTKIALNLVRAWWDDNSLRFVLMAPKKVLVVTEPTLQHTDFTPGVHLVEAPVERLVDSILYYLNHEEERLEIVERAYQLINAHSPLETIQVALDRAVEIYEQEKARWRK